MFARTPPRPRLLSWLPLLALCLGTAPLWAQEPGASRIKIADDGSRAVIYVPGTGTMGTIGRQMQNYDDISDPDLNFVDLFQMQDGSWAGVANDRTRARPVLFKLSPALLPLRVSPMQDPNVQNVAAAVITADGTAYLADRDRPVIAIFPICDFLGTCTPTGQTPFSGSVFVDGPPISQLAIDPASHLAAVIGPFAGAMDLIDIGFGKYLQMDSFNIPGADSGGGDLAVTLIPGKGDTPSNVYLSVPAQENVYLIQIDPVFRELRQTGTLTLRDLAGSAAPFTVESKPTRELASHGPPATARVAASDSQRLVLVGGVDRRVIHVMSRSLAGVTRISDIHTTAPVVDFDVSPNGRDIALLTEEGVAFLTAEDVSDPANASQIRDPEGDPVVDAAITVALQKRLIAEGYLVDVVDGMLGPNTISALQRYTARFDLPTPPLGVKAMQIPPPIIVHLFAGHLQELPAAYLGTSAGRDVQRRSFETYFARNFGLIAHFSAGEIFQLGQPQGAGARCLALNDLPAEALWPNIANALSALEALRIQIGVPIRVVATYQTPEFSTCAGTPADVQQAAAGFRSITFEVDGTAPEKVLQNVEAAGLTDVSVQSDGTLFHLVGVPSATAPVAERLGKWHAIIASHSLNPAACVRAQEDVLEFARLLAGSAAAGLPIYVVRTTGREVFAVTIDTGDDQALARQMVKLIRAAAPDSADRKTGADSLVLSNRGWRLDDACRTSAIIR